MGYYIRVLVEKPDQLSVRFLKEALKEDGSGATVEIDAGTDDHWEQIVLKHPDGEDFCAVGRNVVEPNSLGAEELEEFIEEARDGKPRSAAQWLADYLPSIRVIYAFQILGAADKAGGWEAVWTIQGTLWRSLGGILQSDGEGFSNRDGHHILWQFSESAKGEWIMAVLNESGNWTSFKMDLGNLRQREGFLAGRVPEGVRML